VAKRKLYEVLEGPVSTGVNEYGPGDIIPIEDKLAAQYLRIGRVKPFRKRKPAHTDPKGTSRVDVDKQARTRVAKD
jgi:hypothetical protein